MSLFDLESSQVPLAARLRPVQLDDLVGQEHLLGEGKSLRVAIDTASLHSMIFWGPPGTGKTTLARMMAQLCDVRFEPLSAVLSGVKDIREAISRAEQSNRSGGPATLLFVDEVHRFNKAQQDAFLPYVESGTVVLVGATTENPSFELNNALLSRARVYKFRPLNVSAICRLLQRALVTDQALTQLLPQLNEEHALMIATAADGDARKALNLLELAADLSGGEQLTSEIVAEVLSGDHRRFDKGGDLFYEQISALHKAVRGSSPDGAIYWFCRMLDGGCDPLYIARRLIRMASEDIGNADPRGLQLAVSAYQAQQRLGSPEGHLALAQVVIFLASAAKSNAVYTAMNKAMDDVHEQGSFEVPLHLRNASTALMKQMGHGKAYRYAHDYEDAYAAGESYLPEEIADTVYYRPEPRGLEIRIGEKLERLREQDRQSDFKRYEDADQSSAERKPRHRDV